MNQAIADALLPYGTVAQRDAAIAAAFAAYYTSAQTDAAIAAAIAPLLHLGRNGCRHRIAAAQLSNGQTWNGGPTCNLLRGSNLLRNLSVAGALTASFQNLDDTILIESDSYVAATPAARPTRKRKQAQRSPPPSTPWTCPNSRTRRRSRPSSPRPCRYLRGGRAGQLRHQQLGDLGHLCPATTTAARSIPRSSRLCWISTPGERGSVELLHPGRDAELRDYPRTELDSQLTATFLQYWTSSRTQTEIDDAIAGAGFLTQAQADTRRSAPTEASSPWCAPT